MRPWILLGLAIAFEIGGTTALKLSDGFRHLRPTIAVLLLTPTSFLLLALALRQLNLGVAYAIWSGVGTAVVALIGYQFLGEQVAESIQKELAGLKRPN